MSGLWFPALKSLGSVRDNSCRAWNERVFNFDPVRQGLPDQGYCEGSILLSQGYRYEVLVDMPHAIA